MKKIFLLFSVLTCTIYAQTQSLEVGLRFQKTQNMYWENGVSAQYSFSNFKPQQFYVGVDYVTSVLGTAAGSNALKQHNFIFSGSWLFRAEKAFRYGFRLNAGYFYANYEEDFFDDLPNKAFLFSPEVNLNYTFSELPIKIQLGSGYYIDFAKEGYSPGTFQPLYYHLDVYYTLFNHSKKSTTNE